MDMDIVDKARSLVVPKWDAELRRAWLRGKVAAAYGEEVSSRPDPEGWFDKSPEEKSNDYIIGGLLCSKNREAGSL
mgnify:FL=1